MKWLRHNEGCPRICYRCLLTSVLLATLMLLASFVALALIVNFNE